MIKTNVRVIGRQKRKNRISSKIHGTVERPRLSVFCSGKHIYAQIIEDDQGHTLVSASTLMKELKETLKSTSNKSAAKQIGALIAKRALEKNITKVVFDRSGYIYHGRIKILADTARENGLKF